MWVDQIAPILVAAAGASGITGLFLVSVQKKKISAEVEQTMAQRRKTDAESETERYNAAARLSDSVIEFLEPARQQIAWFQKELADARKTISDMEDDMDEMRRKIQTLNRELLIAKQELENFKTDRGKVL